MHDLSLNQIIVSKVFACDKKRAPDPFRPKASFNQIVVMTTREARVFLKTGDT